MNKPTRFYVGSTGKARGGWFVRSIVLDANGQEVNGPMAHSNLATKALAHAIKDRLNLEVKEGVQS